MSFSGNPGQKFENNYNKIQNLFRNLISVFRNEIYTNEQNP